MIKKGSDEEIFWAICDYGWLDLLGLLHYGKNHHFLWSILDHYYFP